MKIETSKPRALIIFFFFLMTFIVIIINLYRIQIQQHTFYLNLAHNQQTTCVEQYPPRAPIYDRSGTRTLATNKECVSAFITPHKIHDALPLKQFLKDHFSTAYERFKGNPNARFMYIKRHLSKDEQDLITAAQLKDIKLLKETTRYYPIPSACPTIGMTNIDNHGLFGLELHYEKELNGTPSTYFLHKDARSGFFHLKREETEKGCSSAPLRTTLDSDLQFLVAQELQTSMEKFKAKEGAVIIMDPANGDILAMVSAPYTNPENHEHLNINETRNSIITDTYELGSVMKVFAALAALEEGVVTPQEEINCRNNTTAWIEGRKINTVHAHGIIPFADVVANSNNIGIAIVAKRVNEKLYDHYCRLGFGKKTGLSFPGQASGFVNHPNNWSKQSIISLSYGYEISLSLLQLARAFCMIANDGYVVEPRLIYHEQPVRSEKPLYRAESIETIREILRRTANAGTTFHTRMKGYDVMSKTGTACILVDGEYSKEKNRYTCSGIVKKDDYQRVIVTFIREAEGNNLYASTVAAPLFRRVAERMVIHERKL